MPSSSVTVSLPAPADESVFSSVSSFFSSLLPVVHAEERTPSASSSGNLGRCAAVDMRGGALVCASSARNVSIGAVHYHRPNVLLRPTANSCKSHVQHNQHADSQRGKQEGPLDMPMESSEDAESEDKEESEESEEAEEEEEEEEEDEPEDPAPAIYEECEKSKACAPLKHHFDECTKRVSEGKGFEGENCIEEFFHLSHCAQECTAPKLFAKLV